MMKHSLRINALKEQFEYSSLTYMSESFIEACEVLYEGNQGYVLLEKNHAQGYQSIHFMVNELDTVLSAIMNLTGVIYLSFVPDLWVQSLKQLGFEEDSYFQDYWLESLPAQMETEISYLSLSEIEEASSLTKACAHDSRGFMGEEVEFFRAWLTNTQEDALMAGCIETAVLKKMINQQLAGIMITGYYGQSPKRTLWIRELATHPLYRRQKVATSLLQQALAYGILHQCQRAFLMADTVNDHAIHLYQRFGFVAKVDEGQRNMKKSVD